jgi:general stress protein YciG
MATDDTTKQGNSGSHHSTSQTSQSDKAANDKGGSMTTAEAGRKGGQETAKRGSEFYSEIGSQQGKENNPGNFANRPKEEVRAAAAEGGKHSHRGDSAQDDDTSE